MKHTTAFSKISGLLLLAVFLAAPLGAGEIGESMAANLAGVGDKAAQLAEAIPGDKYGWSPSEGVRTVSEAMMHIATANYFFAMRMGGGKPPEGMREWEKTVTEKADVAAKLKGSFEAVTSALKGADMSQATKLFGGKEGTIADMALIAVGHGHEHLGQLIAYARANQIKPPWSN